MIKFFKGFTLVAIYLGLFLFQSNVLEAITTTQSSDTPSVMVLSPNGGEIYQADDIVVFRWKTIGLPVDADTQVNIMDDRISDWTLKSYFGASNPLKYAKLISSINNENIYEYSFRVPFSFDNNLPDKYHGIYGGKNYTMTVAVRSQNSNFIHAKSASSFSIKKNDPLLLTMLSPNGGEKFNNSDSRVDEIEVRWTTKNIPDGEYVGITLEHVIFDSRGQLVQAPDHRVFILVDDKDKKVLGKTGKATVTLPYIKDPIGSNYYRMTVFWWNAEKGIGTSDSSDSYFTIGAKSQKSLPDPNIKISQQHLISLGYNITADGIIGNKTISSIKVFQKINGLPINGLLDRGTKDALLLAVNKLNIKTCTPSGTVGSFKFSTNTQTPPSGIFATGRQSFENSFVFAKIDIQAGTENLCVNSLTVGSLVNPVGKISFLRLLDDTKELARIPVESFYKSDKNSSSYSASIPVDIPVLANSTKTITITADVPPSRQIVPGLFNLGFAGINFMSPGAKGNNIVFGNVMVIN